MVSDFHEKWFPRNCRDAVTILSIQNCQGSVLFINCSKLVYFERLVDFSFVHI